MLRADPNKTAAQRSNLPGQLCHFFVEVGGEIVLASAVTFSDADILREISLRCRPRDRALTGNEGFDHFGIAAPRTQE